MEAVLTIIFLVACWYGYRAWIKNSAGTGAVRARVAPKNIYEWPDEGHYDFEIVGESFYQSAIKKLAGVNNENKEQEHKAFLIPENNNPYDDKAVRVEINGMTVGHLSRENARSFRRRLGSKKLTGQVTSCKAIVTGGEGWDGRESFYGVCLNIKEFDW